MTITSLSQPQLLGSREVQFLARQETRFSHLQRLALDFSFRVLELLRQDDNSSRKTYTLVTDDYRQTELAAITPEFECLDRLNQHVGENMIDILHDYLFGFVDEDMQASRSCA